MYIRSYFNKEYNMKTAFQAVKKYVLYNMKIDETVQLNSNVRKKDNTTLGMQMKEICVIRMWSTTKRKAYIT